VAARSSIVRETVVTGIPSTTARSSAGSCARCAMSPARGRREAGTVTWGVPSERNNAHSTAAERWLSTAPGPAAFTAASHHPSRVSSECQTA
jgi:hypothetical protein